jgi:FkbM family methyltransferase
MSELRTEISIINEIYEQNPNLIIFDVGAHNFFDSVNFKQIFPTSQVFSFEADLENIKLYSNNAKYAGIYVIPMAVTDEDGETTFYPSLTYGDNTHTASGSTLKPKLIPNTNKYISHPTLTADINGYKVQTIRLDTFCNLNDIQNIDYLHVDVQGGEFKVINGLGDIRPTFIFAEVCEFDTYETGITAQDFFKLMEEKGYEEFQKFEGDILYKLKNK